MPIDVIMPAMSPTMEKGAIAKWKVKIGDQIKTGDIIAEVETDKAIMELESMDGGTMGAIFAPDGTQNVTVGQVIGIMLKKGETEEDLKNYTPKGTVFNPAAGEEGQAKKTNDQTSQPHTQDSTESIKPREEMAAQEQEKQPSAGSHTHQQQAQQQGSKQNAHAQQVPFNPEVTASPLARKIAQARRINISEVFGTGTNGRIVKRDVETFQPTQKNQGGQMFQAGQVGRISSEAEPERIPLSGMRKVIARRLTESKSTIPHFYLSAQCEVSQMLELRSEVNEHLEEVASYNGTKASRISVNDIILKAVALAVESNPSVNVYFGGNEIIHLKTIDVCMAISIPQGLVAPKIYDVNLKNLKTIAAETKDVILRAKAGRIKPDELEGGSISVSNLGMMGVDEFFPILNPPQSCIVGIGRTVKTPIFNDEGKIEAAETMKITISADHRSVDGSDAAKLLDAICNNLSRPIKLFIN